MALIRLPLKRPAPSETGGTFDQLGFTRGRPLAESHRVKSSSPRMRVLAFAGSALATIGTCSCSRNSAFSAQYITLPSGMRAYCNRQGYREIRAKYSYEDNTLVTNQNGSFVACDAKVGPDWDSERTSSTGSLLSPDQMDKAMEERLRREDNTPEAIAARKVQENEGQGRLFEEGLINPGCRNTKAQSESWYSGLSDSVKQSINWSEKRQQFKIACSAEQAQAHAQWQAAEQEKQAALGSLNEAARNCRKPYDDVQAAYLQNPTPEAGAQVNEASVRMAECLAPLERARGGVEERSPM